MAGRETVADDYRTKLEAFRELFIEYGKEVFGKRQSDSLDELRGRLQRLEPQTTAILVEVLGNGSFRLGHSGVVSTRDLMATALIGGNNELTHNFGDFEAAVSSTLEKALGTLEAGLWPPREPKPVLAIKDGELKERCADLLAAPGSYDRVIREATLVLEDRIRRKVPHDRLAQLIPNAVDQTAENLVNQLFSPDRPVLVFSSERGKRIALHRMLLAVVSYLRNPSHHKLDATVEWSWAWSTLGLIDRLLTDVDSCSLNGNGGAKADRNADGNAS